MVILALDIDGTLTEEHHRVPKEVVSYLNKKVQKGVRVLFITGRPFVFASTILREFPFPYYVALHNGAILLKMPEEKVVKTRYLPVTILPKIQSFRSDIVIYSGFENRDLSYWCPDQFEEETKGYLKKRLQVTKENWIALSSFDELPITAFPSFKYFGKQLHPIQELDLHIPIIQDGFNRAYQIAQGTEESVHKGQALKDFLAITQDAGPVIAAGNDHNDVPLFKEADIRIVMDTAPEELHSHATIIAKEGILGALEEALNHA